MRVRVPAIGFLALAVLSSSIFAQSESYSLWKKVRVGGDGGWDYLVVDSDSRRLYVTRAMRVMVFDADTLTQLGEIPNTEGVHGVALAPELGRGFTSNGRAGTVTAFDLKSLHRIADWKVTGENPDAIVYDPPTRRVFAFNGRSSNATVLDAKTGATVATLPLGGKPEFAVSDGAGRVFVNIEDHSEVVAIDSAKPAVVARWPLAPCEEPSGMAIDRKAKVLFVGCSNRLAGIVDAAAGKLMGTLSIGAGVDANGFDPGTGLAFSSNGDGTLTVIGRDVKGDYAILQTITTERGARTMAVDEKTHRIYTVTADFGAPPSPTSDQPHPRPPILPGSFTILAYGR
jgi:DNA-binding beta-propeller fold protein YncE